MLVISHDEHLGDVRKAALESAGMDVVSAINVVELQEAFRKHEFGAILIGYSLPPPEKRQAWEIARASCDVPLLEISRDGKTELMERNQHLSDTAEEAHFLDAVKAEAHRYLAKKKQKAAG